MQEDCAIGQVHDHQGHGEAEQHFVLELHEGGRDDLTHHFREQEDVRKLAYVSHELVESRFMLSRDLQKRNLQIQAAEGTSWLEYEILSTQEMRTPKRHRSVMQV